LPGEDVDLERCGVQREGAAQGREDGFHDFGWGRDRRPHTARSGGSFIPQCFGPLPGSSANEESGRDAHAPLPARLVALNHTRAEEEKRGLIRWLRPDYQASSDTTPQHRRGGGLRNAASGVEAGSENFGFLLRGVAGAAGAVGFDDDAGGWVGDGFHAAGILRRNRRGG
jgi:hypothetical protein